MKYLLVMLLAIPLLCPAQADPVEQVEVENSKAPFYYYIVGNWRNGPEVLISASLPGSEQKTMDQLMNEAKALFIEFEGVSDVDIVVEPDQAAAQASIKVLAAKYARRGLAVKELPALKE